MGVKPRNPCPECGKTPDIPEDLSLFLRQGDFYCNYCGAKLECFAATATLKDPSLHLAVIRSQVSDYVAETISIAKFRPPTQKVFISYSHMDDPWCAPFAEGLKSKGFDVFIDNGSISKGADWVRSIGDAIESCQYFLIIITPDAWLSQWVQRELSTAFAAQREIIPVLLKDTKMTGILRTVQRIDVRDKTADEAVLVVQPILQKR